MRLGVLFLLIVIGIDEKSNVKSDDNKYHRPLSTGVVSLIKMKTITKCKT